MKDLILTILQVHNTIMNAAIVSSSPLNYWIISELIMIQNEPNKSNINKLRVINKLEAGYNLVLKFHWLYKATHYSEKINHLGEN